MLLLRPANVVYRTGAYEGQLAVAVHARAAFILRMRISSFGWGLVFTFLGNN